jgi:hypothetical protein
MLRSARRRCGEGEDAAARVGAGGGGKSAGERGEAGSRLRVAPSSSAVTVVVDVSESFLVACMVGSLKLE